MSATIIDGRKIANEVYEELNGRIAELKKKGVIPRVAIVEVGDDEMSKRYVSLKENAAIRKVVEVDQAYLDSHLTLQDVAVRCGYNRTYISGLVKSELGGFAAGFGSLQTYYAVNSKYRP